MKVKQYFLRFQMGGVTVQLEKDGMPKQSVLATLCSSSVVSYYWVATAASGIPPTRRAVLLGYCPVGEQTSVSVRDKTPELAKYCH